MRKCEAFHKHVIVLHYLRFKLNELLSDKCVTNSFVEEKEVAINIGLNGLCGVMSDVTSFLPKKERSSK